MPKNEKQKAEKKQKGGMAPIVEHETKQEGGVAKKKEKKQKGGMAPIVENAQDGGARGPAKNTGSKAPGVKKESIKKEARTPAQQHRATLHSNSYRVFLEPTKIGEIFGEEIQFSTQRKKAIRNILEAVMEEVDTEIGNLMTISPVEYEARIEEGLRRRKPQVQAMERTPPSAGPSIRMAPIPEEGMMEMRTSPPRGLPMEVAAPAPMAPAAPAVPRRGMRDYINPASRRSQSRAKFVEARREAMTTGDLDKLFKDFNISEVRPQEIDELSRVLAKKIDLSRGVQPRNKGKGKGKGKGR